MNQELRNLGKNKEAQLLYKASRDGYSRDTFLKKCKNHNNTIILLKTNFNTVIGGYCPDKWVETTGMKDSLNQPDFKDIVSGKPFLFYFEGDQI